MIKASSKLTPRQIKQAISGLTLKQRVKILEDLEEELFPARFTKIVSQIRSKGASPPLKKITQIAKKARKQLYEKEFKSRH